VSVPLPADAEANLQPPDAAELETIERALLSAAAPADGPTRLQALLVRAIGEAYTDYGVDVTDCPPITAEEFAEAMARRTRPFRVRMVQLMLLTELVLRPLPPEVAARVEAFAEALGVGDDCRDLLAATKKLSGGSLALAMADFQRNGYETMAFERRGDAGRRADELWAEAPDDPGLARRWADLEQCPPGSLGRRMWEFYRARGFAFPGTPGSAPPELAQHDWVHVLADFGTTVQSELEVFGLIARAVDDPRGFTLLVQVLSLFETGYAESGLGLFQRDTGHLSADDERMVVRLGDAMYRGARAAWSYNDAHGTQTGIDFLAVDWFEHAATPLDDVRRKFFLDGLAAKSDAARAAGSVGPWEPGGISPFQHRNGQEVAAAEGRPYESYGAEPLPS
jgi:hypothetical protein